MRPLHKMVSKLALHWYVILCAALCWNDAVAQLVESARISGQPLMYVKEGRVDGCGIRLISVHVSPSLRGARSFDVSINFWRSGHSGLKGLTYDVDVADLAAGKKARTAKLNNFWIKAPGHDAPRPVQGKVFDTEDPGGRMYMVEMEQALQLYDAAITGQEMTVGLRRIGEGGERIYTGQVEFTDRERGQLVTCLEELLRGLP